MVVEGCEFAETEGSVKDSAHVDHVEDYWEGGTHAEGDEGYSKGVELEVDLEDNSGYDDCWDDGDEVPCCESLYQVG